MADSANITANITDGASITSNVTESTSVTANVITGAKGDDGLVTSIVAGNDATVDSSNPAAPIVGVDDSGYVHKTTNETVAGKKSFTDTVILQATDIPGQPGIPQVTADGLLQVKGSDGTKHIIVFPDMDGDGDYDADLYFANNAYLVAPGAFHFRSYDFNGVENGRVVVKSLTNGTSGARTNYIQSAVNFSGSINDADIAITKYNSSFAWALFDNSQNGYLILGSSIDGTSGLYKEADARLHVYDGATTVAVFQGANASGTGRIGLMDINTTSGSAVTLGAFGDFMILRAESTNIGRLTGSGLYIGGNVTPTANLDVAASSTSRSALRVRAGVDPTSPNDGDIWYDGTNLKIRYSGTTYTLATTAYVDAVESSDVDSFNGRTGTVMPASGDYTATQVTNTPAGNIAATNAQTAINELDTEKAGLGTNNTYSGTNQFNGNFGFGVTPIAIQGATTDIATVLSNFGFRTAGTAFTLTTSGKVSLTGAAVRGNSTRTGNVTLTNTTVPHNRCDATSGAFTVTLPAASGNSGLLFRIKKVDSTGNAVTVQANGAELIDGSNTYSLATQYKYVSILCNGTGWDIYGNN